MEFKQPRLAEPKSEVIFSLIILNKTKTGRLIRRWLTRVKRNPECWLEIVQESDMQFGGREDCGGKEEDSLGGGKPEGAEFKGWEGQLDSEGRFHGEGVLTLEQCLGQAGCKAKGLERVEGFWKHGFLIGPSTLHFVAPHSFTEVVAFRRGKRQGLGVVFLDKEKQHLAKVTRWEMGTEVGPSWDLSMGHGLDVSKHFNLVSGAVEELPPTAHWGGGVLYNSSVWIYPDYKTALVGRWGKDKDMKLEDEEDKIKGEDLDGIRDEVVKERNSEDFQGWGRLAQVESVRCTGGTLQVDQTSRVSASE